MRPARRDPRPAGRTSSGRSGLGYDNAASGRQDLPPRLDAADRGAAESQAGEMAERLLANPVIEEFEIVVPG